MAFIHSDGVGPRTRVIPKTNLPTSATFVVARAYASLQIALQSSLLGQRTKRFPWPCVLRNRILTEAG